MFCPEKNTDHNRTGCTLVALMASSNLSFLSCAAPGGWLHVRPEKQFQNVIVAATQAMNISLK